MGIIMYFIGICILAIYCGGALVNIFWTQNYKNYSVTA